MALNGLLCADVPLRTNTLTHCPLAGTKLYKQATWLESSRSEAQVRACRYMAILVSVITTIYYGAIIFHHRLWYCALSLYYACIRHSGTILRLLTFVPNLVSFAASNTELAHGEKLRTRSLTHPAYWMPQEPKRLCFGTMALMYDLKTFILVPKCTKSENLVWFPQEFTKYCVHKLQDTCTHGWTADTGTEKT